MYRQLQITFQPGRNGLGRGDVMYGTPGGGSPARGSIVRSDVVTVRQVDDCHPLARDFAENVDRQLPPAETDGPLFDSGRQLSNGFRATQHIDIFGKNLLCGWRVGRGCSVVV